MVMITTIKFATVFQDSTSKLLGAWLEKLDRKGIRMIVSGDDGAAPKGGKCVLVVGNVISTGIL